MKKLFVVCIIFLAHTAYADWFYTMVKYQCDTDADILTVTHYGAYNQLGEMMRLKYLDDDTWAPDALVDIEDDGNRTVVTGVKSVTRRCRLTDGLYRVTVTGSPDNGNILGMCGAHITADLTVTKDNDTIVKQRFEGFCFSDDDVLHKVVIEPKKAPVLEFVSEKEFISNNFSFQE
jgi:hypothetical protein